MSVITVLEHMFETTEADVIAIWTKVKTGVEVAEKDAKAGLNWLASNTPGIALAVQQVEGMVTTVAASTPGFAQNAIVTKAIADANDAVAGLNAFANSANAGATAEAVVQGYVAYQQAAAAAANAKAAVASAPTAKTA